MGRYELDPNKERPTTSVLLTSHGPDVAALRYTDDGDGLEHNVLPYRRALPFMWMLATWAMLKTTFVVVFWTIPRTLITTGSLHRTLYRVVQRWYEGPPKAASFWFDGSSRTLAAIRAGSQGFRALDLIYNWKNLDTPSTIGYALAHWWVGMINAQAVRNRLRLTRYLLMQEIWRLAEAGHDIRLLSIASGSAQAVMEAAVRCRKVLVAKRVMLEVRLVDRDPEALAYAERLAAEYNLTNFDRVRLFYLRCNAGEFVERACDGGIWRPNIVEMVGFLDYQPTTKAIALVRKIHEHIAVQGFFLTCHIGHNPEAYVLRWLIRWPMLYRSADEIVDIVHAGGFEHARAVVEPHRIHAVVMAHR